VAKSKCKIFKRQTWKSKINFLYIIHCFSKLQSLPRKTCKQSKLACTIAYVLKQCDCKNKTKKVAKLIEKVMLCEKNESKVNKQKQETEMQNQHLVTLAQGSCT
jgi:hypothetical protein